MTSTLSQTSLHTWHAEHGARLVDFTGWSMPVQYDSIVSEHQATRQGVGLFDVSHMGRLRIDGSGAVDFLEQMLTRSTARMPMGRVRYSLVCNPQGGILDDILVYRTGDVHGESFQLVVNAGNRDKIWQWFNTHSSEFDVELRDETLETAMIAVQGPAAVGLVSHLTTDVEPESGESISTLAYYHCRPGLICGVTALISRTGYTGEDGFELIVDTDDAVAVWTELLDRGHQVGAMSAGLGARDTLRLEAAMPLYGHELTEETNPFQAGLSFAVDLDERDFIGQEALRELQQDRQQLRRVGLLLATRRVPREGYLVTTPAGDEVGWITSGTHSPTLGQPIAMAYLDPACAVVATELQVDIRGERVPAHVVELPFYQRKR